MALVNPKTHSTVDPDEYTHTLGYDGNGNLVTDTFTDAFGTTYIKTMTYTGTNITSYTDWVAQ